MRGLTIKIVIMDDSTQLLIKINTMIIVIALLASTTMYAQIEFDNVAETKIKGQGNSEIGGLE